MRNENCWYKNVCTYDSCMNCIRYSEMKYLMDNSGIPKNRQYPQALVAGIDYDAFMQLSDIKDDIVTFVESGKNLYLCSENTGNGKTSWSIKLMLKYFDQVWAGNGFKERGLFIHVPTFLSKLKNFNDPLLASYKESVSNVDLICWDDIASTKLSEYDISQLLIFIDQRIVDGKANIFTGNIVTEQNLEKVLGSRLASRIWNTSEVIKLVGKDRRHGSLTDNI